MVEQEGGKNQQVQLLRTASARGVFEGLLPAVGDGNFHLWMATPTLEGGAPSADFLVVPPPGEFERMQVDVAEMRRAADETRGHFYRLDERPSSGGRSAAGPASADRIPASPAALESLVADQPVFGLITGEWILRKRKGML